MAISSWRERLANRGHYPAIDILSSVSRVMDQVVDKEHLANARKLKEILARYQENEDAILYDMYKRGSDARIDESIEKQPAITDFLKQGRDARETFYDAKVGLDNCFHKVYGLKVKHAFSVSTTTSFGFCPSQGDDEKNGGGGLRPEDQFLQPA